jgi:nitrate reductase delta subunit
MKADLSTDTRLMIDVISSRLLMYPDDQLIDELPLIRQGVATLPSHIRVHFDRFFSEIEGKTLLELQEKYVAVFDLKRRCCLYLTYYLNGDTRLRGMALVRFQATYAQHGFQNETGELPDFLPMLLEFSAHGGDAARAAEALIDEHREGLEVLRVALEKVESPQRHIIAAVLATLPELTSAQRAAARLLVAQGPPTESVGLEPFMLTDITTGARL